MLAKLVLALLAQARVVQGTAFHCHGGWNLYNGKCYGFGTEKVTWAAAMTLCQMYGGTLAEPRDLLVHNWLVTELKDRELAETWLGGTDVFQEGVWVWASDKKAIGSFKKWDKGQPNDYENGQDCTEIAATYNYNWNDGDCGDKKYFVCEI